MVKRSWSIASLTRGFFSPEFSRTEGLPAGTEGSSAFLGGSGPWVRGEPCRVLLFGGGLQELPGDGRVPDGGAGSRPKMAARCRGSAPVARASSSWRSTRSRSRVAAWPRQGGVEPVLAGRPGAHGGLLVDDQVRVGGAGPSARRVSSQARSRRAVRSSSGRGRPPEEQPAAAQVGVAEEKGADGAAAGGVDGGQGHDEAGGRRDGGGDGLVDVVLAQRLQHGGGRDAGRPGRPGWGRGRSCRLTGRTRTASGGLSGVLWRCDPRRPRTWSWMSSRVTSRRWL